MAKIVYLLCALGSVCCAVMLIRAYLRSYTKLLMWTAICFIGLAINNSFLFIDLVAFPEVNMFGTFWRNLIGVISGGVLVVGLIWELT